MGNPQFPVIAICPGDSFIVHNSMATLEAVSAGAIASGYLERLYIFDIAGDRWRVAKFEKQPSSIKGPFGNLISVRLFFHQPDRPSLSDIAADLCRIVDADPDDVYSQFLTAAQLASLLRTASTSAELVNAASTLGATS